jgi:cell wall-associated NlpC family hydrolase
MRAIRLSMFVLALAACDASGVDGDDYVDVGDVGDDEALKGVDEVDDFRPLEEVDDLQTTDEVGTTTIEAAKFKAGDRARVCTNSNDGLRQRTGPGTGYASLRVMPEGTTVTIVQGSGLWYKNNWGGRIGWSHGNYLCKVSAPASTGANLNAPLSRTGVISISKATVGFSYWWGGARFAVGGGHGSCYGSCPSCSHSGSYGADCSGLVGKAWKLPEAMPMTSNKHPFSTYHFYNQTKHWNRLSRSSMQKADALVYNSGSSGHIVIYESGNRWGSMWTYEARGCSYGVVHNLRTAGSAYRAIHRTGI